MKRPLYISVISLILAITACADFLPSPTATPSPTVAPRATAAPVLPSPTNAPSATIVSSDTPAPAPTLIPTTTPAPSPTPGVGATRTSQKDDMVLMYVPAGEFKMGTTPIESTLINEKPQHVVFVDAFWMDKTEITNARYALCVNDGKCAPPTLTQSATRPRYYGNLDFNNYPLIGLTWDEAKNYCAWAGQRLPTEAEWEKAARGVTNWTYPWGNTSPDSTVLNFGRMIGDTSEVNKYPKGSSQYGIWDLAGNVSEWIADWYDEKYYEASPAKNPTGAATGQTRVVRGGAWDFPPQGLRAAQRQGANPLTRAYNVGFRCVTN